MNRDGRTLVLLTGFGPFPTQPVNATAPLVGALEAEASHAFPDIRIETAVLATEWATAPVAIDDLFQRLDPDIALHFGISASARGFEIEARAHNACSASDDAAGTTPTSSRLADDGPERLSTTLPAALIVANLRRAGMPAHLSWNAGTYLCNAVLYRSLSLARARPNLKRNGFIHVPAALRAPGARRRPFGPVSPLTWQQAVDGSLCILATCLGRPSATAAARTAQR